jgi:hypothetical protein
MESQEDHIPFFTAREYATCMIKSISTFHFYICETWKLLNSSHYVRHRTDCDFLHFKAQRDSFEECTAVCAGSTSMQLHQNNCLDNLMGSRRKQLMECWFGEGTERVTERMIVDFEDTLTGFTSYIRILYTLLTSRIYCPSSSPDFFGLQ